MRVEEYLKLHAAVCERARAVTAAKGHDYSGTEDTLANLKAVEALGLCTAEKGILVRLCDKFKRLSRLVGDGAEAAVKDESVDDTLVDVINYAILLKAVRDERKGA